MGAVRILNCSLETAREGPGALKARHGIDVQSGALILGIRSPNWNVLALRIEALGQERLAWSLEENVEILILRPANGCICVLAYVASSYLQGRCCRIFDRIYVGGSDRLWVVGPMAGRVPSWHLRPAIVAPPATVPAAGRYIRLKFWTAYCKLWAVLELDGFALPAELGLLHLIGAWPTLFPLILIALATWTARIASRLLPYVDYVVLCIFSLHTLPNFLPVARELHGCLDGLDLDADTSDCRRNLSMGRMKRMGSTGPCRKEMVCHAAHRAH
ncbi:hypothetical protein ACLOJK_028342 [Asimina triloba]